MPHDPIAPDEWALVQRYLLGEASPEDARLAQAAIARDPRLRLLSGTLRATTQSEDTPLVDVVALKARIDTRRDGQVASYPVRRPRGGHRARGLTGVSRALRHWSTILAATAGVIFAGVVWWQGWHRSGPVGHPHMYRTAAGERATLSLTDGTRVILAPQSWLIEAFHPDARRVMLQGEAYFTVNTAGESPFIVHTDRVTTRVLGTAFDVRHYDRESMVRVAVISGRVGVSAQGDGKSVPAVLTAGSIARVTDSSVSVMAGASSNDAVSWTRGTLVFRETPIPAMLEAVGQWYGYHFTLADSLLARQHVTTAITLGDLPKTMTILKDLLEVNMTVHGDSVTLYPRRHVEQSSEPNARRSHPELLPISEAGR